MSNQGPKTRETPARRAALIVGRIVRTRRAFTQEIIAKHIDASDLLPEERAFATKLALGVTSTSGTLDNLIDRCLRSPSDIKPEVRDALRISTYEIIFLDKDAHAAVDQGVELAKSVTPKVTGLANSVLRKVVNLRESFPFGDIETDNEALARYYAFPLWLAKRLIDDLGHEAAVSFMKASNEPAPLFIAVNNMKGNEEEIVDILHACGTEVRKIALPGLGLEGCFRLNDPRVLNTSSVCDLFNQGAILVSDASSQVIASLMTPSGSPDSFLEIGSGRGTKTILLQSNAMRRFGRQLPLSVMDNHEFKIDLLTRRMNTYGGHIEQSYLADARKMGEEIGERNFKNIFIDAPCSGLGTLRRHPEIRWKLEPEDISKLAVSGLEMLIQAAKRTEVGGVLGYATCTVMREENSEMIRSFLSSEVGQHFSILPVMGKPSFMTLLSPGSSDAHFAVRMVRES